MASGRLIDYLGQGDLSDRPATPDLAPGGLGFYYATDESTLYVYSDNGWEVVISADSWVSTIVPGTGILVDDSDPENPVVSVGSELPELILAEGAAPATPDAGTVKVYAKTDSRVYAMDDTGAETPLGGVAPVVTVTGTSRTIDPDTDAGAYLRFTNGSAKTATFDSAEGFSVGQEFHITNRSVSGNLTLTEAGTMTLNPPKGGSLVLEPGDTVTVKMVATDEADVMGSTEAV